MHEGHEITTLEGLATGSDIDPVQPAFIQHDAFQSRYCTPGQSISSVALLTEGHTGSAEEIREWISANICRSSTSPTAISSTQYSRSP